MASQKTERGGQMPQKSLFLLYGGHFLYMKLKTSVSFSTSRMKYQATPCAARVKKKETHLKKVSSVLLVRVPADWALKETVMKIKEGTGNTFNCDAPCAACHTKLVPRHAGVETCVRFGRIPYTKIPVIQDGDPVVGKENNLYYCKPVTTVTSAEYDIKVGADISKKKWLIQSAGIFSVSLIKLCFFADDGEK